MSHTASDESVFASCNQEGEKKRILCHPIMTLTIKNGDIYKKVILHVTKKHDQERVQGLGKVWFSSASKHVMVCTGSARLDKKALRNEYDKSKSLIFV